MRGFTFFSGNKLMALQKVATATYLSTPHSSKFARLAFDDFCSAIIPDDFLRIHHKLDRYIKIKISST